MAAEAVPPIVRQIKARIGAASLLLDDLGNDAARLKAASRAQSRALIELTRTPAYGNLSQNEKCGIMDFALKVKWCEEDIAAVSDAISPNVPTQSVTKAARREQQNFVGFLEFFSLCSSSSFSGLN